jgi:hypothetical protein
MKAMDNDAKAFSNKTIALQIRLKMNNNEPY